MNEALKYMQCLLDSGIAYPDALWKTAATFNLNSSHVNDLEVMIDSE